MDEISVQSLSERLPGNHFALLDVREPWEYQICHLPDAQLIPLDQLPGRLHELPQTRPLIVICHHGVRSRYAQQFLIQQGVADVLNLTGGMAAWAAYVDPTMPTY